MPSETGTADIIIKNGKIVDGSGAPYYYADLAIRGNRIAYIGNLSKWDAALVIDATGKLVTPGFIDCHSHSDISIWANPECQSTIRQGVTTEVVGNCGLMVRPSIPCDELDHTADDITCVYDKAPVEPGSFRNVLLKAEKMGVSENMAWLCGLNALREAAGIKGPEYTEEQFDIMEGYLREALDAGYLGMSTGLEFEPGRNATPQEINRLAAVVAEYDGIYTSHVRNGDEFIMEANEECYDVLRSHGIRGTVSHLKIRQNTGEPENGLRRAIARIHEVREKEGLNVLTDMISMRRSQGLMAGILPPWVFGDRWEDTKKNLSDPEIRKRLRTDCDRYWRFIHRGDWHRLSVLNATAFPKINGMSFQELAKLWAKDEWECFFDILAATNSMDELHSNLMMGTLFPEEDLVDSVIKDPLYMWEEDGYTTKPEGTLGQLYRLPQFYMGITHFFTHYVRDKKYISIEKAVNKMALMPATHYRLNKRGLIAPGYYADINVFALENLETHATFDDPCVYTTGMDYVIVNGVPVIAEGKHTAKRPGQIIRSHDWGA